MDLESEYFLELYKHKIDSMVSFGSEDRAQKVWVCRESSELFSKTHFASAYQLTLIFTVLFLYIFVSFYHYSKRKQDLKINQQLQVNYRSKNCFKLQKMSYKSFDLLSFLFNGCGGGLLLELPSPWDPKKGISKRGQKMDSTIFLGFMLKVHFVCFRVFVHGNN